MRAPKARKVGAYDQAVKGAARGGVPGAEAIVDDLARRFPDHARPRSGSGAR